MVTTPGLTFEEKGHIYRWNGERVPSVTTVLKDQGMLVISPFSKGPDTGTAVHDAVRALEMGYYDSKFYPPGIAPHMKAYRQFKSDVEFKLVATEMRVFNEARGYAGALDLLGLVHTERSLVDIKTGVDNPATAPQVAAYWGALSPGDKVGVKCYTLYIKGTGKYNLVPLEPAELLEAWQDWLAGLRVYNFRKANNLFEKE